MDNYSRNQYYRTFSNTNNMSQEELYQNYINFINNTTQILNNTVLLLSNQQNTYNNLINQHNFTNARNSAYSSPFTNSQYQSARSYIYRPSPLSRHAPININDTIFMPSIFRNARPAAPTINDLINNVSYCIYNDISNNTNDTCPITQREFTPTDIVLKINSCNHIFDPQALLTWLSRNNACPMCRHNITEQVTPNLSNNNEENDNNNDDNNYDNNNYYNDNYDNDNDNDNDDNDLDNGNNNNNSYPNYPSSFALELANLISNELYRDSDFSGNIQIELGLSGRQ
jgi:hypothetical protein